MSDTMIETAPGLIHRPAGTGRTYVGPGDLYTFLITGEETNGAYFAMEAWVPPGGGPPPHIHTREDETFYVLEGELTFRLASDLVIARAGDFVNVPRGLVHCFRNDGEQTARMILTFTPSGIEHFFEETLERLRGGARPNLDNVDEVAARYAAAAPRYGMEFVTL